MAGPLPTYLTTQLAAQTAFTVPFGLITLVNNAITTAQAAGEFNVTVDCSLFAAEDVSNLRIYLDSLGYLVQYAKGLNEKGLNIDWSRFLDIPGSIVAVTQGTTPWVVAGTVAATQSGPWSVSLTSGSIEIGTVDQGHAGTEPWLVDVTNTVNAAITNFPAVQSVSGTMTAVQGTTPWTVDGSVSIVGTVPISGSVTATQGTSPWIVDGSGFTQPISGSVNILNFPATVAVTQSTSPWVVAGSVSVSNFPAVQPVSGTVTALQGTSPWTVAGTITANAGTGTFLVDGSAHTQPISGTITANQGTSPWVVSGTITTSPDVNVHDGSGNSIGSTAGALDVSVANFPATQPVSGTVTVVQPTGTNLHTVVDSGTVAATQSGTWTVQQGTPPWSVSQFGTWNLNNISGTISLPTGATTEATLLAAKVDLDRFTFSATRLLVDGSGATQPISGTVTANQGTSPWVVSGTVTANAGTGTFLVDGSAHTQPVSGTVTANAGTGTFLVDGSAHTQPVSGTVAATQSTSPWVVSGTVTANAGTGNFTVVQPTGTNLHTVLDSGTLTSITNALPAGTNVIGHVIADSGSTTAVTGNVTVVQPTGTNLHAVVDSGTIAATQSGAWTTGRTWTLASGTDSVAAVQSGTWTVQPGNTPNTAPWLIEQRAPGLSTYSAAVVGLAAAATPTDIFTIYGSGTKTVKVIRIEVSATQNTAAVRDIVLIKRSATNTGGTSAAVMAVPHDTNNAGATATALSYTANPAALGAAVGTVRAVKADIPATNLVGTTDIIVWDFANRPGQALVLRGTSQGLAVNLNGVTSASNSFDISIEWTEE